MIPSCQHRLLCRAAAYSSSSPSEKPRIVLIGWLGAQQRHFDKCDPQQDFDGMRSMQYPSCPAPPRAAPSDCCRLPYFQLTIVCRYIQLWQGLGHETLAVRPPTSAILVPPIGDWIAGAFLERLQAAATADPERPVVFHIFRCLIVVRYVPRSDAIRYANSTGFGLGDFNPPAAGSKTTAPVHLHLLGHHFLNIALTRRCCSNAGFLFLGTLLRLSALSAQAQPGGDSPQGDAAAGNGEASRVVPGVGRMDGIILDSAPAPITPDIAARWADVESCHHLLRYNMQLPPPSPGAWRPRPSPQR